jgi:probable rRNA maturation factor
MKKEMNEIVGTCTFNDHEIKSGLRQKKKLGGFINHLIDHYLKKPSEISYTFVNDDFLLSMNQTHLNHDTYTDIITFDLSEKKSPFVIGDIYISIDRVIENAKSLKASKQDELLRVILHGALHLSGFGDKTKKESEKMRNLEDEWMKKYQELQ